MINPPKGIEFRREFEPDMKRMVQALKVVLEAPIVQSTQDSLTDKASVKEEPA
ncbi:hypothetical protein O3V59_22430 [Brevibacillus thermoruber]|uniref:Uncharacterized protein n=1 Tax=Brevibacillus thermoruber TaxID=33942 RepID=A0A9X3Z5L4_9BACL|nr:hypothetical protein [Brevibacillus thermoruber]MDA5111092.1 hypothetical protein [Brevibacillus thermoruber]